MAIGRRDAEYIAEVRRRIGRVMFGLDEVVQLVLAALYTGGHVLLEGNPGLGKTALVRTVCAALGLTEGRWGRIQFTPDLLPADITGTRMPLDGDRTRFAFQPGPVFRWLLLADEINRATPKTQSAMLEAMAERQVTVLGETHRLGEPLPVAAPGGTVAVAPPFMVLATQNPVDHESTFDLPEAQADRFMFKLRMPFPDAATLVRILGKDAGRTAAPDPGLPDRGGDAPEPLPPAAAATEAEALWRCYSLGQGIRALEPSGTVQTHIVNLVLAANGITDGLGGLGRGARGVQARLAAWHRDYVDFGAGPRAAIALMLGAKAWAGLFTGAAGTADFATALARVALPALRHRIKLVFDWDARFARDSGLDALRPGELHDVFLAQFVLDTAPDAPGYREVLAAALPVRPELLSQR